MRPLPRAQRVAAILWIVVSVVVWNGVYDLVLVRGIKETLLYTALFDAGRGSAPDVRRLMDISVFNATWISTVWASAILLAGLLTIRLVGRDAAGPER